MFTRRRPDVVLIHPPSVYDFREKAIFYGPISDVIPSSPVFEMYPVGFLTLAAYLRRHGYRVRIVNLALLMMRSRRFDAERFLRKLRPSLFGIDLHWLPHAHGGPTVAALLKKLHPEIPIAFGGLSSTYFHEELIRDPSVDFILRGTVTEPSFLALLREVQGGRQFASVPDLTWKEDGEVHVNASSPPCASLDDYGFDLGMMVSDVVSNLDFWTTAPFHTWWQHPITAIFTVRGCTRECVTCGASHSAFGRFMRSHHPILRSPEAIAVQARQLAEITKAPIFLVGDVRDGGPDYAGKVIDAIGNSGITNRVIFEFFDPPSAEFLQHIDRTIPRWGAELSPESHDESIRALLGKARFTNERLHEAIENILALRCEELDLFYMVGLPKQTYGSVLETVDSIEQLFRRFDRRLSAFITPMGPFIDPGSIGFEQREAQGYILRARTLAEHRALLEERDWESILNYETKWMTRSQIVDATYDAAERLNALKAAHHRIPEKDAAAVQARLVAARRLRRRLQDLGDRPLDAVTHRQLIGEIREYSEGTVNDKAELFEPAAFLSNFRMFGILKLLLRHAFTSAAPRSARA